MDERSRNRSAAFDDAVVTSTEAPRSARRESHRSRLPTLNDDGEIHATEDTERNPESVREPFANRPLPSSVEASLEIVRGTDGRCSHGLVTIRSTIGRGPEAAVQISDRKASRKHASVFYTGSEFRIRDEGSANGTLLNGSKVVEYAIRDGDDLLIGDTLLRFRLRTRA